ncbi:hypothetical protein PFY01_08530 [Brevundimonas vesicularis]|uniref:hypothetical protein n=1 Tax=Brevundimonas vesicularis TaxID=41276 RepID=UPI0022EC826B|nr:hypothetical protein [Brevundimonas vesicularis]WBT04787.1 hypothetical protein PFY01_08530 [Brevundimonas vesicularis]
MDWERREDGELVLSVLQNFELATFTNEALAVRLESLTSKNSFAAKWLCRTSN